MSENLNTTPEAPETPETTETAEVRKSANPSFYLDRKSSTILMIIKLAQGLSELCFAILAAFVLQTVVSALNRIFQEGTTISDGKAMVAQFLSTLQVPKETIKEIVDAFPLNFSFSSKPVVYVFIICLPFVLLALLEAFAAIRLRLGKGGTRTIGILHMIYYVLGGIRLLAFALLAIGMSIFTIFRLGGTAAIMISTVYVSLAVFFILIGIPTLLYHRTVAGIMGDIGYEMETGLQAPQRHQHFGLILKVLIILEVIGVIVSFCASWRPGQQGLFVAFLIAAMIGPVVKLVKYACVMYCYRNFANRDNAEAAEENISHVRQIVLIVLVILLFAVPNTVLCVQSNKFATVIVEKVEEFFSNARQTVNDVTTTATQQIEAVQAILATQMDGDGTADVPTGVAVETTVSSQDPATGETVVETVGVVAEATPAPGEAASAAGGTASSSTQPAAEKEE